MAEHHFKWRNDGRLKIMIGCGTRPEIICLAAVMKRCREYFDTCMQHWFELKDMLKNVKKLLTNRGSVEILVI